MMDTRSKRAASKPSNPCMHESHSTTSTRTYMSPSISLHQGESKVPFTSHPRTRAAHLTPLGLTKGTASSPTSKQAAAGNPLGDLLVPCRGSSGSVSLAYHRPKWVLAGCSQRSTRWAKSTLRRKPCCIHTVRNGGTKRRSRHPDCAVQ